MNKTESASLASCPPPAGVVVVTGDPPTGRGQLAALLKPEGISPFKIQLLNRPRKRVTPIASDHENVRGNRREHDEQEKPCAEVSG
jgi:hypothetical protein